MRSFHQYVLLRFSDYRCRIPKSHVQNDVRPLILQRDTDQLSFVYPNDDNEIIISKYQFIYLACSGEKNHFKTMDSTNKIVAQCIFDTQFIINERTIDITTLTCESRSTHLARYKGKLPCLSRLQPIEIGFHTGMSFIRIIELCFNDQYKWTPITYFKMSKMIGNSQNAIR